MTLRAVASAPAGGGNSTLTINSTATSGATVGQILLSDGSKLQAGGAGILSSLALGGATIGTNALAVTGVTLLNGSLGFGSVNYNIAWNSGGGIYANDGSNNFAINSGSTNLTKINTWNGSAYVANLVFTNSTGAAALSGALTIGGTTEVVNGTTAQTLRVYGTSSSANANYERLTIAADAYTDPNGVVGHYIGAESGGTGGSGKGICLSPAMNNYVYVKGYGIFMPDGGTFASNLIYTTSWVNMSAQCPGWGFYTNYASNLIQFKAAALKATYNTTSIPFIALGIDAGNQRVGVLNGAPSYTLDVTGDVNTSTKYRIGGNIVLAGQSTGYGTPTGGAKTASFSAYAGQTWGGSYSQTIGQNLDNAVVTLSKELAQLIVDLKNGLMPAA